MSKRITTLFLILLSAALILGACQPLQPDVQATTAPEETEAASTPAAADADAAPQPAASADEPVDIRGQFSYSNSIITDYYVEHAVALVDMYAFVQRDLAWEIPVEGQTLGYVDLNPDTQRAEFFLQLPVQPDGQFVDVDHDGQSEIGVQVFTLAYWPNLTGGPYSVGDDRSLGWPSYLASVKTDSENKDEVIGGDLIIWSPDGNQSFPSGFGADGLLFTDDDPVAPISAGYTLVNLDSEPFTFSKEAHPELTLYEPKDVAIKDFSKKSYTQAFDAMFEIVSKEYAFNGIEGKQPDWDALYAELSPRVQEAEANHDAEAFALALRDFTWAFKDGHVGMSMTQGLYDQFIHDTAGGYGFAIRELDDGRFIVTYVMDDGPAAAAGIQPGDEMLAFNGQTVDEALAQVKPWSLPMSSDWALRYQQARYLLRAQPGDQAEITFKTASGQEKTVTLTAIEERESFSVTSIYANAPDYYLPVDFEILDSGVGYVRLNSNYDDLNLIIRLFERALKTFEDAEVPGIIIDLRYNSGGAPLGLAGFLTDQEITMGQLQYYSETTGQFENEGLPEKVYPNEHQYRFDKMVLMVGQTCYSACEIEAYGFSQVPGMIVVGQYPTGGVEAEVARGQFILPDEISLQIPTGRFVLPDGSIFLEGVGVQPTLRVPINEETVFAEGDVELDYAERAVLQPLGAGITPAGPPKIASTAEAQSALLSGVDFLEAKARENPSDDEYAHPGAISFTVPIASDDTFIWGYGWCAKPQETLEDNFKHIRLTFNLDGETVSPDALATYEYEAQGQSCRIIYTALSAWPVGEHHLSITATFTQPINDGSADYEAGDYVLDYTVYVKP